MVERTIDDPTRDLAERRRPGEPAPVVLLAAGASAEAGIGTMGALYAFMHVKDREEFAARIAIVITTNFDPLLDDALVARNGAAGLSPQAAMIPVCEDPESAAE